MKKRVLSLLLCTAMVMSLAVGCGSSDKKEAETKEDTSKEESVTAEAVDQRTVYVTPEWVKSVIDGN